MARSPGDSKPMAKPPNMRGVTSVMTMASTAVRRGVVVFLAIACLAGCGLLEPTDADMRAAIVRALPSQYKSGVQIEYFSRTWCRRHAHPSGYFCRFLLSTNTKAGKLNEGLFHYDHGWHVKLSYDPAYPS
jgi:hypothetical protein